MSQIQNKNLLPVTDQETVINKEALLPLFDIYALNSILPFRNQCGLIYYHFDVASLYSFSSAVKTHHIDLSVLGSMSTRLIRHPGPIVDFK